MNERCTLQGLAGMLAQRCSMEQADADVFVREFFALVKDAVLRDKYVRVKGLGTFKLIDTDDETSRSHISFTPDVSVRNSINKPFAHFEMVALNETVHFDDVEEETLMVPAADETDLELHLPGQKTETGQKEETTENGFVQSLEPLDGAGKKAVINEVNNPSQFLETDFTGDTPKRKFRLPWCFVASVLLIGILIGGGVAWGILSGRRYIPEQLVRVLTEIVQQQSDTTSAIVVKKDTLPSRTRHVRVTLPALPERSIAGKAAAPVILSDTVRYAIVGTLTTHMLRRGESLARLAQHYYGNKNLWPYLVRYNREVIKDADDIPVGTSIRIPKLARDDD